VVDCSPEQGGRTRAALGAVSDAAANAGAAVGTGWIGALDVPVFETLAELGAADAVVLGSPVYRASFATPLKRLLDAIPRGGDAGHDSVLAGKPVGIVLTAASWHHFLALGGLRDVLAGFFAAHVLPPGLYVPREGFDEETRLSEPFAAQALLLGAAVVEAAGLLGQSRHLRTLRPQA
jgi:FMN reductase